MFKNYFYLIILVSFFFQECLDQVKEIPLKNCNKIQSTPGPEDIAIDRENQVIYISSHDRRNFDSIGRIYSLDISKENYLLKEVKTNYPPNFRPHGISLRKENNKIYLYAISHPNLPEYMHSVEQFEIIKNEFKHIQTLKDSSLTSPNDLFATEDGKLFVSNDHGNSGKFMQFLEDLIRFKGSDIAYFDGSKWHLLNQKVNLGNGILIRKEKDSEYLYRASTITEKIFKYKLDSINNLPNLKLIKTIELDTAPDNLEEDGKGNLIIGAHKSIYRFLWHASKQGRYSPSQILLLNTETETIKEIYANKGEEISSSSGGIIFKDKLYIAQVFEDYILRCSIE